MIFAMRTVKTNAVFALKVLKGQLKNHVFVAQVVYVPATADVIFKLQILSQIDIITVDALAILYETSNNYSVPLSGSIDICCII
jgi:hypothetical protein